MSHTFVVIFPPLERKHVRNKMKGFCPACFEVPNVITGLIMCNYCWFKQVSLDSKTLFSVGRWSQASCNCQPSPPILSHNNTLIIIELPIITNAGVNNNKVRLFSTKPTLFWYYCSPPGARRRRFFRSSKLQFHLFHWNSRSHSCNPFSIPFFIAVWSPGTLRQSFLWLEERPGAFRHHELTRAGLFAVQSLLWVTTRHSALIRDFVGFSLPCAPLANMILSILLWNLTMN